MTSVLCRQKFATVRVNVLASGMVPAETKVALVRSGDFHPDSHLVDIVFRNFSIQYQLPTQHLGVHGSCQHRNKTDKPEHFEIIGHVPTPIFLRKIRTPGSPVSAL
jgi:hypothetical protein